MKPLEIGMICRGLLRRQTRRQGVRILTYHGIVRNIGDPLLERNLHTFRDLQDHIGYLRRWNVLPPNELFEMLRAGDDVPDCAALITFDDGYENNLLAAEAFTKYKIPWMIFVTTGLIDTPGTIWTTATALLLLHGEAQQVGMLGENWSLSSRALRERAFEGIRSALKKMCAPDRETALAELRSFFPSGELERLVRKFPSSGMCSWSQVRELASAGVCVGSHGVFHELHHPNQDRSVCQAEMVLSKQMIETRVGVSCSAFCFPNGDINQTSEHLLRSSGYSCGFTTQSGCLVAASSRWAIPRIGAPKKVSRLVETYHWEIVP